MTPTLLVFAGYVAAELLLDGIAAAVAVLVLALAEYLFMLLLRKERHLSLIVEGAVLAAIVLAGDLISRAGYPGAGFVILELVLGAVLLVSALRGRPWLKTLLGRFPGLSTGSRMVKEASVGMGLLLLVHGVFMTVSLLTGHRTGLAVSVLLFLLLYVVLILFMRRRARSRSVAELPGLSMDDEGKAVLSSGRTSLGRLELRPGSVAVVGAVEIVDGVEPHRFLEALETALRRVGCRSLRITQWQGDILPLEMAGYRESETGWTRPL